MNKRQRRWLFGSATSATLALSAIAAPAPATSVAVHPTVAEYVQLNGSTVPPTQAQCASVGRRCFAPQAIQAAYNVGPLYGAGVDGRGQTIAIVDSYGSDTIAHDLHVFNTAFGLQPMCGEEAVTCAAGLPTFSVLHLQGSPATTAPPPTSKGPGQEDRSAWALEVSRSLRAPTSCWSPRRPQKPWGYRDSRR